MDKYEFYEEIDENTKKDSTIHNDKRKNLKVLDKISHNKSTLHNIEFDLISNNFIPRDEDLPLSKMNFEDDFEPCDDSALENDLRFKKEVPESKQIFKYHPNIDIHYFKQVDTKKKAYWLGFLFADGFIKTNKGVPYRVGIDAGIKAGMSAYQLNYGTIKRPKMFLRFNTNVYQYALWEGQLWDSIIPGVKAMTDYIFDNFDRYFPYAVMWEAMNLNDIWDIN